MIINPHTFLKFIGRDLILWDYKNHRQYALTERHLKRLLDYAQGKRISRLQGEIDSELIAHKIIVQKDKVSDGEVSSKQQDCLSEIFHIGTQNIPLDSEPQDARELAESYIEYCMNLPKDDFDDEDADQVHGKITELPGPSSGGDIERSLKKVLFERKTCREFSYESIDLQTFADIMHYSFGFVHKTNDELRSLGLRCGRGRKLSPSGGNIHAVEAYPLVLRVCGLEDGVYHYMPTKHCLRWLGKNMGKTALANQLSRQTYAEGAAFGIYLTYRFDRLWRKYHHSRAYRVAMMDVGHTSQTFQIIATAYGLNTFITGAFQEELIEPILGVDSTKESSMLFLAAGKSNGRAIPQIYRDVLCSLGK